MNQQMNEQMNSENVEKEIVNKETVNKETMNSEILNLNNDFPLLTNASFAYLDNSSTTQKPQVVIDAVNNFYSKNNSNVHRGVYRLAQEATINYQNGRKKVADFIGAETDEIIFTGGTTASLNMLARMLELNVEEGDEILVTDMEHHSNLIPWQMLAKRTGAIIKFIPLKDYRLDLEKMGEMITGKTKLISITHMSNVLGTINPMKEITELAHKVGALVVVDAAQSVAHLPINVKSINCDFLTFSGHKMFGPTGIGVLYGNRKILGELEPVNYGGGMVKDLSSDSVINPEWLSSPAKFEAGTPPLAQVAGLTAAIDYLQRVGMPNVWEHSMKLTSMALDHLRKIDGVEIIGPNSIEQRGPVFSFVIEGKHPHDLAEFFDSRGIAVRGGHHCAKHLMSKLNLLATTRASFCLYNTAEEVRLLGDVLKEITTDNILGNGIELIKGSNGRESIKDLGNKINDDLGAGYVGGDGIDEEMFRENVIDHYQNPRYKHSILGAKEAKEINHLCGDEITLFLKEENQVIKSSFIGNGCAISQAAASLLMEKINGLPLDKVSEIKQQDVVDLLGIPISHTRLGCALLPWKALQKHLVVV